SYEKKDRAYLAVLEINNPLGDVDFYAMEIAATSILMEMKRRLAIKSIEERNINNFIYDLIYQSDKKEKEILHEAHSLDLIYTAHYATIIIEFKLLGEDSGKNRSLEYFSPLQDELIFNSIVKYFKELNERNTIGQLGTSVIVLYSFSNDTASNADTVKCVCDKLRQNFSLDYPDHIIQVGAGSICSGILGMSESYNDARTALTYGLRTFGRSSFVIQYNDNSLLKIISCLEDSIDIRSLIPKVLFDIMDYDQQHHSDFLNTLSNYLNNNCNASETAAQMFVHNKTIQYRLDRIRSLFHLDYNDCDERFGLTFGVKALNLLDNTK
ncbi:MAG: hypothetical protein CVU85_08305, partial [Firmicutes bacterium HGW-Firmicutes-10]